MRPIMPVLLIVFFLFSVCLSPASAIVSPLSVPNNRIGVHILDPNEIFDAAKLVNSGGGDWGYVTIPIRSDDRDLAKWTQFMQAAGRLHLIPIIRLITYHSSGQWVAPTAYDLVDFSNFLNGLPWPVKNRYIVLFNEPNHAKEWGGTVSPSQYASLLANAKVEFKSRSDDFFLISAGLDISAPTNGASLDAFEFYRLMSTALPSWYENVDGLGVHAYPNPGFSASVYSRSRFGITSYRYELSLLESLGYPPKPLFITETGHTRKSDDFFLPAFTRVWTEENIVAITPFILFAGAGEFTSFSLLDTSRQPTASYRTISTLPKLKGSPQLSVFESQISVSPLQTFVAPSVSPASPVPTSGLVVWLKSLLISPSTRVVLNGMEIQVEVSATEKSRSLGLSGRKNLGEYQGMLFIFDSPGAYPFWMNNMHFPLDIIWIFGNKIVQISPAVPPPSQTAGTPVTINPGSLVDKVLEVNSGLASRLGAKVGDTVVIDSE